MSFTDEEVRMKAVEISFEATSDLINSHLIKDSMHKLNVDYFQFTDEIVKYIRTGEKTSKRLRNINKIED